MIDLVFVRLYEKSPAIIELETFKETNLWGGL